MKPSHWLLPSDHGTHLTVLLPLPTRLSCHKFEQFQYLAENRNKANHCWFCWARKHSHNDNLIKKTIYPMWMMRSGLICLNFYSSDMILHLSVSWCHMRMSEPLSIIITLRQCVFSQWSASSNVILLYVLFNFYRGNFGFCDVRLSIDLNYLSSSHR